MSREQAKHDSRFLLSIIVAHLAFSMFLLLTACGRGEIEPTPTPTLQALNETALAFETIEQKDGAGSAVVDPGIIIISSKEDVADLPAGSDEAIGKLQKLDYEQSFALIVFQGEQGTGGFVVTIERITRVGTTINVYVQFHIPKPEEEKTLVVTSPYHLVQVQKSGEWDQEFLFQVIVDGTVVASINHFIP
jgi:hypothetical protein